MFLLLGVLLYSSQAVTGKGDFISLNLVKGYLQFRFDLGGGIANIKCVRFSHICIFIDFLQWQIMLESFSLK